MPVIAGTGSNTPPGLGASPIEAEQARRRRRSSPSARTTTVRRRPASTPTSGRSRRPTDLPVLLYDIPMRTGRKIDTATLMRARQRRRRTSSALKDAAGNPGETAVVIAQAPDDFEVYSGDDPMTLPLLAVGAVGVDRRGDALVRAGSRADVRRLGAGRRRRRHGPINARHARELRVRDQRRCSEPASRQGDAAHLGHRSRARHDCRWATRPRVSPRPAREVYDRLVAATWLTRQPFRPRPGSIRRSPCASSSSAGSARSAATAWPSSRAQPTTRSHDHAHRLRPDVPRRRHARHRPDPARLHLPARERRPASRAASLTHGHEDHVGALQYLLRDARPSRSIGSALTLGLAPQPHRGGRPDRPHRHASRSHDGERSTIGPFDVEFIPVTHSVPHAHRHRRPHAAGRRSCTPVTSSSTSPRSTAAAPTSPASARSPQTEGIRLLMADSHQRRGARATRRARPASAACSASCSREQRGRRIITACFASHLHRIQQIADAAIATAARSPRSGLSMKKNVRLGRELGRAQHPRRRR